jgi:hypothetical protein
MRELYEPYRFLATGLLKLTGPGIRQLNWSVAWL